MLLSKGPGIATFILYISIIQRMIIIIKQNKNSANHLITQGTTTSQNGETIKIMTVFIGQTPFLHQSASHA